MKRIKKEKGFTLFEVIIAASLLIVLLAVIGTIFTAGINVFENYGNGLSPFNEVRLIFERIEDDLLSNIGGADVFRGSNNPTVLMDFLTLDSVDDATLAVRYQFNSGTGALVRISEVRDNSHTLPGSISGTTDTLSENVQSVAFRFYGGNATGILLDPADSNLEWPGPATPVAVKVDLQIQDSEDPTIIEDFSRIFAIRNQ